jgi:hypothetical protein
MDNHPTFSNRNNVFPGKSSSPSIDPALLLTSIDPAFLLASIDPALLLASIDPAPQQ